MADLLAGTHSCLNPECGSSDGRRMYADGTSFCFACKGFFTKAQGESGDSGFEKEEPKTHSSGTPRAPRAWFQKLTTAEILTFPIRGFKERMVTKTIAEFYQVRVTYDEEGQIDKHYYPYDGGEAYKIRSIPKEFVWVGKSTALFGRERFPGGGKRIIITEGEIDCMSVAQASLDRYKKIYPVVAMSSSVMTKSLLEAREWLRSFQEVILMLDMDEPGQKATAEAIRIIGADKVKVAKLPEKDPNEVYLKHGFEVLNQCVFDAEAHVPPGIMKRDALWEAMVNYNLLESHPYPACMDGVNSKVKGKRVGEIALFISGTGSGKSTMLREDMINVLETTEDKIGIVSLEEAPAETARKLSGMSINRNPAESEIPIEDLKVGFDKVFGDDRVILLDHQGSMSDTRIIDQLEYMALAGCKYLYVDHFTILVSEGVDNLTGNEAQDKVMNDLLRLVKRYPIWIGLVSHLRKAPTTGKSFEEGKLPSIDDIKGSGSIKQICFDIISFSRDLTAEIEDERNRIKVRVLKSRYTGLTGSVDGSRYIRETGRLVADNASAEDFTAL
jgi:twinkle protein